MTTSATQPGRDRLPGCLLGVVFVVAVAFRVAPFVTGTALTDLGDYDDGVYLSGSMSLWHGTTPYDGFVFVHPPGALLALLPFSGLAAVTSDPAAAAAAHVAWMLLGAVNAVLLALVVRRWGRRAALVAGLTYAAWAVVVVPDRTYNLVTLSTTLLLLAVLALGRRPAKPALAGALTGLAMSVKVWALLPFVALALVVLATRGRTLAVRLVAGVAASTSLVCLPFFVRAPGQMWHQVVATQLGRPRGGSGPRDRVGAFFDGASTTGSSALALLVLATMLVVVVPAASSLVRRRSDQPEVDVLPVLAGLQLLTLLVSSSFFPHYLAWVAPGVAVGAARLVRPVPHRSLPGLRLAAVAVAVVVLAVQSLGTRPGTRHVGDEVRAAARDGRCVWSADASLLLQADVLSRDLRRGCGFFVDAYATTLAGRTVASLIGPDEAYERSSPGWQRAARRQLLAADVLLVAGRDRRALSVQTLDLVARDYRLTARHGDVQVFVRR